MGNIMNTMRSKVVLVVVAVVVLLVIAVYFFLGRISDSDYQAATTTAQNLTTTVSAINDAAGKVQLAADINDTLVADLKKSATTYNKDLNSLATSVVVTRDQKAKTAFDQNKNTLTSYGLSATQLATSLAAYNSLLSACSALVGQIDTLATVKEFDAAATGCKNAITAAKSAPSASFNDQFLREYTGLSTNLLDAYRQLFVQADSGAKSLSYDGINLVKAKIVTLGKSALNLTPAMTPSGALQEIAASLNS
jgi:hypothetical protein